MDSRTLPIFLLFTVATLAHCQIDDDVRELDRVTFKHITCCKRRTSSVNADLSYVPDNIRELLDWDNYQVSLDLKQSIPINL